jgi:predicted PurR-regulated permease PerM
MIMQGENQQESQWNITLIFAFIISAALLLFMMYLILPALSPIVVFLGLVFILHPFRENRLVNRLLWLSFFLFCIWIFDELIGVLMPFVISFLIAYILNPLVNRLERKNIPRWLSALVIITVSAGLTLWFFTLVMPIVFVQFQGIVGEISTFATLSLDALRDGKLFNTLKNLGIPTESLTGTLEKYVPSGVESILSALLTGASNLLSNISSIVVQILNIVLIPFVTFYLLKDFPRVTGAVSALVPETRRSAFRSYLQKIDGVLGQYFRGAMIVAIIQGIISTVVLSLLGVHYAVVLGIMTALLDFIPYVGLIISLVVSTIVACFSGDPVMVKVIGVIIMYIAQKIVENSILAPKIIGKKVGLHPVLLMMSLFVFGYFFGFVGLLIAVPLTAVLVAMLEWWKERAAQDVSPPGVIT